MNWRQAAAPTHLLLDTHVLVWLMFGESRLGSKVHTIIQNACAREGVLVSAITPWEIGVLVSKKRIDLHQDTLDWMRTVLAVPGIRVASFSTEVAIASTGLPFEMHADPADRILVATARNLGATLVTADQVLLNLAGKGHFAAMDATS